MVMCRLCRTIMNLIESQSFLGVSLIELHPYVFITYLKMGLLRKFCLVVLGGTPVRKRVTTLDESIATVFVHLYISHLLLTFDNIDL